MGQAQQETAAALANYLALCGAGRWVPLLEVFGRGNAATARRRTARGLHGSGALRAAGIAYYGDCVQCVPAERVEAVEAEARRAHLAGEITG